MSELFAVDVSEDFITTVVSHVEERLRDEERITVLFPNRRAVRFFEKHLRSPLLLRVKAAALEDFAKETVYTLSDRPPTYQLEVDRYFMLHDILKEHSQLYHRLGGSVEHVFPWCLHLSNLFDEFDQHLITSVAPLQYIEEVVQEAREILLSLDTLYESYRRIMDEKNLTYQGDIYRRLAVLKDELSGSFVLAGFSLLTEAQKTVFLHLFKHHKAAVFFHTDLMERHPVTNPYRLYDTWMDGSFWGVKPVNVKSDTSAVKTPEIYFYESFDTHAEAQQVLKVMNQVLKATGPVTSPLDVGIILPDSQSLFPVLYALEPLDTPRNVTLGFPFERSVFYRLLDTLTELVLTQHEERGFYHASLLKFLAHPFVQTLRVNGVPFEKTAMKLQQMIISRNLSFVRLDALKKSTGLSENDLLLCKWVNDKLLIPFTSAKTLEEAGNVLTRMIRALRDSLSQENEELERQMVQNLLDKILPNLSLAQSSRRDFSSPKVLSRIIKHLVRPLHIPFEGNPLEGIQVMGMLESRLLSFSHLLVLDTNEGILPQGLKVDPLFPPSLNPLVGLPSLKMRESLFQYTFFRLVDSSEDVHIFYQNGISGEEKRIRSRFAEQLLLEKELKLGTRDNQATVKDLETSLIEPATFEIPTLIRPPSERPGFYGAKLEKHLSRMLSPTFLDEYLTCPHRFYLKRILGMAEEDTIEVSQSAPDVGRMVHRILQESFSEFIGTPLTQDALKKIRNTALKKTIPYIQRDFSSLSPLRTKLLIHLTTFRLNTFFTYSEVDLARYHSLRIVGVEKPLEAHLKGYHLYGKVDRIDEILETADAPRRWRIIDYKTGTSAKAPTKKLSEFLKSFDFSDYSLNALPDLKRYLHSIQLPMYLYLFKKTISPREQDRCEATLYQLGTADGNIASETFQEGSLPMDKIAALILYLIEHMRSNKSMAPYDLSSCSYCPYLKVCKHTTRAKGTAE
ncbi:MAG: PD-(D/E)XK nuclease family protein [Deltaproteobacteria bacterium]|nr:PD-(D/E)XK nuclease family protein [Deltaproteobacteria bacterium]